MVNCDNTRSGCSDLSAEQLGQRYRKWVADERHLMASFPLHQALTKRLLSSARSNSTSLRRALMAGHRYCPTIVNSKSRNNMESSTCPWYLELTYDINRYPMYLANARCRCEHCVGMGIYVMGDAETKCKEIIVKVKVIRRKETPEGMPLCNENGTAVYTDTWEDIAVGCTCTIRGKDKQEGIYMPRNNATN